MGVTINHKLGQYKPLVKSTLDNAQALAERYQSQAKQIGIPFEIRRLAENTLYIDIGNCETLAFDFKTPKQLTADKQKSDYSYQWAVLTHNGKKELDEGYRFEEFPKNEKTYSADFCKTQFSKSLAEHRFVAEIIRAVAGRCFYAEVNDEGDYYHTGKIGDAKDAIEENGKLIASIGDMLSDNGWNTIK